MKLAGKFVTATPTQAVFDALAGFNAWFVGGCVRNGLMGRAVEDIDICTNALPDQVIAAAETAGLKAVPTGIDHGTVTLVAGGTPYEVTTLRRDVATDGRRAVVAFSDDIAEDAARRDFTMNALYAGRDGTVLDPNGEGLSDLARRRVRFIGDPSERIAEDYLRILRFFRFFAHYADPEGGIDAEGLAACAAGTDGLARVCRERVGSEMLKLLSAPDPAPAVAAMGQAGVLTALLPGADAEPLILMTGMDGGLRPDPIRRLSALGGGDLAERLRLSKADAARLERYQDEAVGTASPAALGYRFGREEALDMLVLRAVLLGGPAPNGSDVKKATGGAEAVFPVKAADLMPTFEGPALGAELKRLEGLWITSGFALSKTELLGH